MSNHRNRHSPPDINISGSDFTADGNTIRFGLSAVRNVGEAAVQEITSKREAAESLLPCKISCRGMDSG